jgi:hypothetical protein
VFQISNLLHITLGEITMLPTKPVFVAAAVIATLSVNGYAVDRQDNPLHPAYYSARNKMALPVIAGAQYVDAGNPLHPTFAKTTFNAAWIATGAGTGKPYVDSRNPLHPSFSRF